MKAKGTLFVVGSAILVPWLGVLGFFFPRATRPELPTASIRNTGGLDKSVPSPKEETDGLPLSHHGTGKESENTARSTGSDKQKLQGTWEMVGTMAHLSHSTSPAYYCIFTAGDKVIIKYDRYSEREWSYKHTECGRSEYTSVGKLIPVVPQNQKHQARSFPLMWASEEILYLLCGDELLVFDGDSFLNVMDPDYSPFPRQTLRRVAELDAPVP